MKKVVIMVGNIGSGKSTHTKKLQEEGYVVVSRDALRYSIGAGDYIFNLDYESTIHDIALYMYESFLKLGVNIIFDETNMSIRGREELLILAKEYGYTTLAWITKKINKETSVKRRLGDNHGNNTKEVWEKVWDMFDRMYEEPTVEEGFDYIGREDIGMLV